MKSTDCHRYQPSRQLATLWLHYMEKNDLNISNIPVQHNEKIFFKRYHLQRENIELGILKVSILIAPGDSIIAVLIAIRWKIEV